MLISDEYKALNSELHGRNRFYGANGHIEAKYVDKLCRDLNINQVLDYGCGKESLKRALPAYKVAGYDPAFEALSKSPIPAPLVVCADVLEHIEPDCLNDVLDDLKRVLSRCGYFVVAISPSRKLLKDGRNTHLIVKPMEWWLPKIMERWSLRNLSHRNDKFTVVVKVYDYNPRDGEME